MGTINGLLWTYVVCNMLIDILDVYVIVFNLNKTFMGLTILGVGNALPDGLTTIALAKKVLSYSSLLFCWIGLQNRVRSLARLCGRSAPGSGLSYLTQRCSLLLDSCVGVRADGNYRQLRGAAVWSVGRIRYRAAEADSDGRPLAI